MQTGIVAVVATGGTIAGSAERPDDHVGYRAGQLSAEALLAYRSAEKVVTTYGEKFLALVHPVTGRLHSSYAQARTATGRLASSNPNGQNLAPVIKQYIRPEAGRVFACVDLSQAELRLLAAVSGDQNMLAAFASGEDLHARTAGLMFGVDMAVLADLAAGAVPASPADGTAVALQQGTGPSASPTPAAAATTPSP